MLPVFVVSATSLGLLGRPTLLYLFRVGVPARPCVPEACHDIVDEVAAIDEDLR